MEAIKVATKSTKKVNGDKTNQKKITSKKLFITLLFLPHYCFDGECGSRNQQCEWFYGNSSGSGEPFCYDFNVEGTNHGACGPQFNSALGNSPVFCKEQDKLCGKLFCDIPQGNKTSAYQQLIGES